MGLLWHDFMSIKLSIQRIDKIGLIAGISYLYLSFKYILNSPSQYKIFHFSGNSKFQPR
jgi:hypothetical protein